MRLAIHYIDPLLFCFVSVIHAAFIPADQVLRAQIIVDSSLHRYPSDHPAQSRQDESSCWELISDGRRLHQQFVVRSVQAGSLKECQRECEDVLFQCETIAFGENRFGNSTCDLSDWDVPSLSLKPYSTDTLPAAGFAVYSRFGRDEPNRLDDATDPHSPSAGRKRCKGGTRVDHKEPLLLGTAGDYGSFQLDAAAVSAAGRPHQSSITENVCYSVVFTGRRLGQRYIERSVAVISLDECKLLCTRETTFDCRSFNYRRRGLSTNCDLSREDSASLDISSSFVFYHDPDVDYYQRVGKGQACYRPYRPTSSSSSVSSSYYEINRPIPTTSLSDCYRRLKSGYRLDSRIVRDSINVRGLYECENECHRTRTFLCRSFSFRTGTSYNSAVANCELSDFEPRDLDPVRHLVIDRDADIFERNVAGRNCRDTPITVWNNNRPVKPIGQCFLRTKSGIRLDRRAVRYTVSVNSPIECEQECVNAQFFTCRAFSYRYSATSSFSSDAYHKAYDNCDLSDIDLHSLDPIRDLIEDRLYDTWQRTGYRGCDLTVGTIGYGRSPIAIPGGVHFNGLVTAGIMNRPPETYSYTGHEFLDERDEQELMGPWGFRRPLPHPHSGSTPRGCFVTYRRGFRIHPRLVREALHVRTLAECELECSRTRPFSCHTFHFRYTNLNGGYERNPFNCELADLPANGLDRYRGDMIDDLDYEIFTRSPYSSCTQGLFGLTATGFSSDLSPVLSGGTSLGILGSGGMDVTVGGHRCRWGSRCRPHRELGYWYCEISEDNSATTNWDYCCQPQSRCGYSDGFHYPWCYVGSELSGQWRPCSDRYAERPYAYLHRQLPPNSTELAEPGSTTTNTVQAEVESNAFDTSGRADDSHTTSYERYVVKSSCHNQTIEAEQL